MGASATVTYGAGMPYETEIKVQATESSGGVTLTASVSKGVADLRGLFFDVGGAAIPYDTITAGKKTKDVPFVDNMSAYHWARGAVTGMDVTQTQWGEGLVNDLGNGANVKGGFDNPVTNPAIEDGRYDFGVEFGTQGIGKDDIGSTTFFLQGVTIEELYNQAFAIRLTSTDDPNIAGADREGSLKLTGIFDPPKEDGNGFGYSPGYWKNHGPLPNPGNQADDWNLPDNTIFSRYFGLPSATLNNNDWLIGLSFDDALALPGGDAKALARQATAAALNSVEETDDVFKGYAFSQQEVIDWTNAAFTGNIGLIDTNRDGQQDWNTQSEAIAGLKNVFETYNSI